MTSKVYLSQQFSCASGMSFLALDTKGDLARNYGTIATKCYGYQVSVVDLRNPTRSDGSNFLTLVNKYMSIAVKDSTDIASRARAEKYAKILAKTIFTQTGDEGGTGLKNFYVKVEHMS